MKHLYLKIQKLSPKNSLQKNVYKLKILNGIYLKKKKIPINNNINIVNNSSSPTKQLEQRGFRSKRSEYLKLKSLKNNSKSIARPEPVEKKEITYNYNDFIWKSVSNPKDFNDFGDIPCNNDKKTQELEIIIKELEDKLQKKDNDFNRVNMNYAKLAKRSKNQEQENLLETISKLKVENKELNKELEKYKAKFDNFIGISFISDDLESSFFTDDFCIDKILEELNKGQNDVMIMNNLLQKSTRRRHEHKESIEFKKDDKKEDKEDKDDKENARIHEDNI